MIRCDIVYLSYEQVIIVYINGIIFETVVVTMLSNHYIFNFVIEITIGFKVRQKKRYSMKAALKEMVIPQKGEMLGRVIKLVGGDNIIVKCTDGKVRTCRIRGKIKRRMWIRDNDLVLVPLGISSLTKLILYGDTSPLMQIN